MRARAYLRDHEDHLALQRLRRNHQLTRDDLTLCSVMDPPGRHPRMARPRIRHRVEGPAVAWPDGNGQYWVDENLVHG